MTKEVRRGSLIMPEKKKKERERVKVIEDLALGGEKKKKKSMVHGTTQGRSQGNI